MRRCALLVAICMLTGTAGALADAVSVTADRLNLRAEPSTDSRPLGIVTSGEKLKYICEDGQWLYVRYNGQAGYVNSGYVLVNEPGIAADVEATVNNVSGTATAKTRVNLRSLPTTAGQIVKVIDKGDVVTITGLSGCWYRVTYSGQTGFVRSEYFDATEIATVPQTPDATAQPAAAPTPVTTARVNMRFAPSIGAAVVAILDKGTQVNILSETGSWYRVSAAGHTGYLAKTYVSTGSTGASAATTTPAATTTTGTATTTTGAVSAQPGTTGASITVAGTTTSSGATTYAKAVSGTTTTRVNLRSAASTVSSSLIIVPKGAKISVLGESGTWYRVTYNGQTGYIAKNYVTLASDSTVVPVSTSYQSWAGETTVIVNLRRAPEGEILDVLTAGTEVTVVGQTGAWYMVRHNDDVGYLAMSYVIKKTTGTSTTTTTTSTGTSESGSTAYITGGTVNVRTGPGTGYGVLMTLSSGAQITVYSLAGGWYKIAVGSTTGYVSSKYVTRNAPTTTTTTTTTTGTAQSTGKVVESDWWTGEISTVFARGTTAMVTDVDTGLSFYVRRTGGINHADSQPLTAADTAIMKRCYGGTWKWDRRAIWVTINGRTYAASMNGMPHGESDSMPDNNFDGCFCIHFTNSRTHSGNRLDAAHQAAVKKALAAGNK